MPDDIHPMQSKGSSVGEAAFIELHQTSCLNLMVDIGIGRLTDEIINEPLPGLNK